MGFFTGLACTFRGLLRLVTTPALWGWSLFPVILTFVVLVALAWASHGALMDRVIAWTDGETGGFAAATAISITFWLVWMFVSYFVFAFFVRLIAAPLLALLADRTVGQLIGRPSPAAPGGRVMRWVLRPVAEAVLVFLVRCAITLVALPLLLIPVAGTVLFSVVMMGLIGLDLLDIAQSGRGVLIGARLRFVARHLGACLGLGVGAGLLLLAPCVNVLLLPATVVAAVLLDQRIAPDFPKATAA